MNMNMDKTTIALMISAGVVVVVVVAIIIWYMYSGNSDKEDQGGDDDKPSSKQTATTTAKASVTAEAEDLKQSDGSKSMENFEYLSSRANIEPVLPPRSPGGMIDYGAMIRSGRHTSKEKSGSLEEYGDYIDGGNVGNRAMNNNNMEPFCDDDHKQTMDRKQRALDNMMQGKDDPNQPIIYERRIYANRRSRTRGNGDYIRGDIPIVPREPGWFSVAARPSEDLQQGAISVLAGDNDATKKLQTMLFEKKYNGKDGVDMSGDLSNFYWPTGFQ